MSCMIRAWRNQKKKRLERKKEEEVSSARRFHTPSVRESFDERRYSFSLICDRTDLTRSSSFGDLRFGKVDIRRTPILRDGEIRDKRRANVHDGRAIISRELATSHRSIARRCAPRRPLLALLSTVPTCSVLSCPRYRVRHLCITSETHV